MKYTKELKRDNGTRIQLIVSMHIDFYGKEAQYKIDVRVCPPKKRIFTSVIDSNSRKWRVLDNEDKRKFEYDIFINYVTEQEIKEAKLALWELLKPV